MGHETHAGEDVPIFAGGARSELFHGVREQNYIYHAMVEGTPVPRDGTIRSRLQDSEDQVVRVTESQSGKLAEIEQVVGVKESCGDLDQIAALIASVPAEFDVLSGDDWALLPLLAIGGKGVISTSSNLVPNDTVELVRAWCSGDPVRARDVYYHLRPIFEVLFCESNPIPLKTALALRGLISDELRLPLTPMTQPAKERLQVVMKEYGLL